jgi:tape measure domain-containing protein
MDRIDLMVEMIDKLTGPAMKMGRSLKALKSNVSSLGSMASRMNAKIAGVAAAVQAGFSNSVFGRAARGIVEFKNAAGAAMAITGLRIKAGAERAVAGLTEFARGAGAAASITGMRLKQGLSKAAGNVTSFASDVGTAFKRSQLGQALGPPLAKMGDRIRSFAGAASGRLQAFAARGKATFQAFAGRAGSAVAQFAAKAQMNIGLAGLKIQAAMQRAGAGVAAFAAKAGPHLKNLGQKFLNTAKSAGFMGAVIAGVLAASIVGATVKLADFSQRSTTALEMLTGGVNQGRKAFDMIRKTSEDLGLDIVQTTQDFQKLISVGFGAEQANTLVKMGADMTALGVESGKVTSILDAMGKIQATGSLQGDELMMLAEAGINIGKVYDKLGAKFGKTRAEIVKMKEAGKITSADAIEAIQGVTLDTMGTTEFGQARTKVLESSIGGAFDRIKSKAQGVFLDIGKKVAPKLSETLGAIGEAFTGGLGGGGRETFITTVAEGVKSLADGIQAAIPYVKSFLGGLIDGFKEAWPAISQALGGILDLFGGGGGDWMATARAFGTLLGQIVAFGIGIAAVFGGLVVGAIAVATGVVMGLVAGWQALIGAVGSAVFAVEDFFMNLSAWWERLKTDALNAGIAIVQGLVAGIQSGLTWIAQAAASIGSTLMGGIKSALGIASPSKETMWAGEMVASGFLKGIAPIEGLNPLGGLALPQNDNGTAFGERPMVAPAPGAEAGAAAGAAYGAAVGGGGGGAPASITVNINLDNPPDDPKATAQEMKRITLAELGPAIEELMLETGSG